MIYNVVDLTNFKWLEDTPKQMAIFYHIWTDTTVMMDDQIGTATLRDLVHLQM